MRILFIYNFSIIRLPVICKIGINEALVLRVCFIFLFFFDKMFSVCVFNVF